MLYLCMLRWIQFVVRSLQNAGSDCFLMTWWPQSIYQHTIYIILLRRAAYFNSFHLALVLILVYQLHIYDIYIYTNQSVNRQCTLLRKGVIYIVFTSYFLRLHFYVPKANVMLDQLSSLSCAMRSQWKRLCHLYYYCCCYSFRLWLLLFMCCCCSCCWWYSLVFCYYQYYRWSQFLNHSDQIPYLCSGTSPFYPMYYFVKFSLILSWTTTCFERPYNLCSLYTGSTVYNHHNSFLLEFWTFDPSSVYNHSTKRFPVTWLLI